MGDFFVGYGKMAIFAKVSFSAPEKVVIRRFFITNRLTTISTADVSL